MISETVFAGLELLSIDISSLRKLDNDLVSLQGKLAKTEAELAGLRPSQENYDAQVDRLETKIRSYRSQIKGVAADIESAIGGLENQVKLNPNELVEADQAAVEALDKEVLNKLFEARDILKKRGEAAALLQRKIDIANGLGASLKDTSTPWGGRWAGWELAWADYLNRHALLFAGGRGNQGAWALFSDGEA